MTTFKTALINATLHGKMATDPGFKGAIDACTRNLVWNESDGHDKMDHFIENYWKLNFNKMYTHEAERVVPLDLHKRLTQEDIENGAGPQWFRDAHPEYQGLLKLYSRSRMAFDDATVEVCFQKLRLKRTTVLDKCIVNRLFDPAELLTEFRILYHRYFWMTGPDPTGMSNPGQLFAAGENDITASTALITSKAMTDDEIEYALTWVPSISFDIKSDV